MKGVYDVCMLYVYYNSIIRFDMQNFTTTPRNEPGAFNPFEICLQIGHPKENLIPVITVGN